MEKKISIGMLLFPNITQLDLTGPYEVLSKGPNSEIFLISKFKGPVKSEKGLEIVANASLDDCPQFDVLFVPGGIGVIDILEDDQYIDFIKKRGETCSFITSVCTESLALAVAGLLDGYKATTHWLSLPLLELFGVNVVKERVVIDRNRITGGGVTSGIDFGLSLLAHIYSDEIAKEVQLMIEYDPKPPFESGSPSVADEKLVGEITKKREGIQSQRKEKILRILERKK